MAVHYRPVREEELPETAEIFLTSLNDLRARLNLTQPPPPREYVLVSYRHIYRTGIFEVAEVDGRLGAICHAVVRGPLWFLSGFWALPELQGQKIGRTLLRRVWDQGARAGASVFFTWSSTDLQAMASYMKMGMLPGYQTLTFSGTPGNLARGDAGYETRPLDVSTAAEMDGQIRAARREVDHEFWRSELKSVGRQLVRDNRPVGYYYVNKGTIGPAAWLEDEAAEALLNSACREALNEAEQVRLMIPGPNHTAIRFALQAGLKLVAYAHHLTTAPFGQMEKYLSSGPSLF
ncbi:MAG TPA: GNAT family N-acetyltransferase [Pyrinomonadaceae bacterium]